MSLPATRLNFACAITCTRQANFLLQRRPALLQRRARMSLDEAVRQVRALKPSS